MIFIWGSRSGRRQINGVPIGFVCNCKNQLFNIIYDFKRYHIYWIPLGKWSLRGIHMQCIRCGKIYRLDRELFNRAKRIYSDVKNRQSFH